MSSVAMPPSPSTSRAFHNKPYYPNLTLRRSSRLLASVSSPAHTNTRGPQQQQQSPTEPPPTKRRRTPNATPTRATVPTDPAPVASSSKRKADSVEEDEDETSSSSSPIMSRRKKRKENAVTDKSFSLHSMRATIQNKPRPRSSTNKYGTRSAAISLPVTDAIAPTPALEGSPSEHVTTSRQPTPPPPSMPPKVIDEIATEESACPPSVTTHIITPSESPFAPTTVQPSQQDVEMYIPEIPVPSPPSSSYVTYTDLTPSFPERQFHDHDVDMQSAPSPSPQPSLLSELDGFAFSCDPDLDPHITFASSPLQDQMEAVPYGTGHIDEHEWNALDRQRQMEEYERQKRESMRAGQRQDRLWISWTSKKFNYLIEHYGGIGEVRALLKAQIQRAEAHKTGTQSSNKENTTALSSPPPTSLTVETHSPLPIQPSFEMYSPETEEGDAGDKSDMEDEEDEEEDSDSNADDDMVPEPEINPNFELPPAPVLSPLKANPCSGRLITFGTPPFLERRMAWGGESLLTLSMKTSTDLQQVRPQHRRYAPSLLSRDLPALSYPAPSAHSPYIDAPSSSPYPPPSPMPSYPEPTGPLCPSDFSSGDLAAPTNTFDDPSIMQAIIASMSPSGLDFNFNWTDGMGSLPEVTNRGWQPLSSPSISEESSSLPRSSHTLSASSSTLHSALG